MGVNRSRNSNSFNEPFRVSKSGTRLNKVIANQCSDPRPLGRGSVRRSDLLNPKDFYVTRSELLRVGQGLERSRTSQTTFLS